MHYTGPKNRLARRLGVDLGLKGAKGSVKLGRRLTIPPGQHGPKGRRRTTEFGTQLAEKQKLKFSYNVAEKQLRHYYEKAAKVKGATGEVLLSLLETRLDNTLYRLGFVPTRSAGRQAISHNHVLVNGKKVNIPSYQVEIGDVLTLSPKGLNIPSIAQSLKNEDYQPPTWLEKKAAVGKIVAIPKRNDIKTEVNEQLIVEFYSR